MAESKDRTCSVCLEQFSEPKILPCCHTFCLKCLEKIVSEKAEITCPQCRKTHAVPAGGLQGFLTDFIVSHEVEVSGVKASSGPLAKKALVCGECEGEGPVESYCRDCQAYLCSECSNQAHKKFKSYRGHKVIPVQDLDAASLQSNKVHYCSTHKNEVMRLYCETCNKLACRDCTLVEHRQHSYKFVQDARKQINSQLMSLVKDGKQRLATFKANLGEIQRVETTAANYPEVLKSDINAFFDGVIQSIEKSRQHLLTQAETECQKDLKQFWADKDFHQATIHQINAAIGLASKACKCTSDVEMILTALQSIKQLSQLKEMKWDASAFTFVVGSPAKFRGGTKPKAGKLGYVERTSSDVIVNDLPTTAALGTTVIFNFAPTLLDQRSQQKISLQVREVNLPETKVLVKYGHSQKLLNTVSVSQSSKSNSGYVVTMRVVCGGKHTIEIEVQGKPVKGSPFSLNVTGHPQEGARVRPGPDWNGELEFDAYVDQEGTVQSRYNQYGYNARQYYEYEDQYGETTVNVYWDNGYTYDHYWGGPYEIELV